MSESENPVDRREFIKTASSVGLGAMVATHLPRPDAPRARRSPNDKIVIAVIGLNGRGAVHAQNFSRLPNVEVSHLCDVDSAVLANAMKSATAGGGPTPLAIGD